MNKNKEKSIKITKNGPYLVCGNIQLAKEIAVAGKDGDPIKWRKGRKYALQENYALCRCGKSKNKPFCDGNHLKHGFNGKETASKNNYLKQADKIIGPCVDMTDAAGLCSSARFCHRAQGAWDAVSLSDNPKLKETAIQEACDCPSGRLVAWDKKTGKPIEPKFEKSISLIHDEGAEVSGPIWVKGGIPIEGGDGKEYETRNRVTLCRCGKSKNKPFCDGSHFHAGFKDED